MNKAYRLLIVIVLVSLSFFSCKDEAFLHDTYIETNGVIVGGVKWLWTTPFDTANVSAYTNMSQCVQFDNKAIMGGYLNGQGGLYCVNIETGEVVWRLPIRDGSLTVNVIKYIEAERALVCYASLLDIDKIHLKINVDTGEVLWRKVFSHKGWPYAASDTCYYYTQYYPWENRVQATFKVSMATGDEELFYATDLKPAEGYGDYAPNSYAAPFIYEGREYVFMFESRYDGNLGEFFTSLVDAATGQILLKQLPNSKYDAISRADVYNGRIYAFTDHGYMEFDMEQLRFIPRTFSGYTGNYKNHRFYNGKLILAQLPYVMPGAEHLYQSLFVYDLESNALVFELVCNCPRSLVVLDDYLYITDGYELMAYNLENGSRRMFLHFSGPDLSVDICSYKNAEGDKFVLCSNVNGIYCIPGI